MKNSVLFTIFATYFRLVKIRYFAPETIKNKTRREESYELTKGATKIADLLDQIQDSARILLLTDFKNIFRNLRNMNY